MKQDVQINIRPLAHTELPMLEELTFQALYVPPGAIPPNRGVLQFPEIRQYYENWGRPHDICLVAERQNYIAGGVWVRQINGFGYVDDHTPELAMSVFPANRGLGIGTALLKQMILLLKQKKYAAVSLSVQKANYAAKLYFHFGFATVRETAEDYILLLKL